MKTEEIDDLLEENEYITRSVELDVNIPRTPLEVVDLLFGGPPREPSVHLYSDRYMDAWEEPLAFTVAPTSPVTEEFVPDMEEAIEAAGRRYRGEPSHGRINLDERVPDEIDRMRRRILEESERQRASVFTARVRANLMRRFTDETIRLTRTHSITFAHAAALVRREMIRSSNEMLRAGIIDVEVHGMNVLEIIRVSETVASNPVEFETEDGHPLRITGNDHDGWNLSNPHGDGIPPSIVERIGAIFGGV